MFKKGTGKKYLAEFVYGGTDGAITTFAVVAGVMGASLSYAIVLILGFANLFADGLSMALSDYLSTKSQNEVVSKYVKRHHPNSVKNPRKTALVTFSSFIIVGFIPLFPFVLASLSPFAEANKFLISIILTGAAFIVIGSIRGRVTGKSMSRASIETLSIGALAALIAYFVGYFLSGLIA